MPGARPDRRKARDAGFTLLEVISTCLLLAILTAIAVGPWRSWEEARSHADTTRALVSVLRNAQTSAVSENVTYRVDITSTSATSYRLGSATEQRQKYAVETSKLSFTGASFVDSTGAASSSVFFYPRGAASKGSVTVSRSGRAKSYTVSVEGLTARVSYTE
jgi:prepilin-type N-terminal cleavage/methylation domain-containing protein